MVACSTELKVLVVLLLLDPIGSTSQMRPSKADYIEMWDAWAKEKALIMYVCMYVIRSNNYATKLIYGKKNAAPWQCSEMAKLKNHTLDEAGRGGMTKLSMRGGRGFSSFIVKVHL